MVTPYRIDVAEEVLADLRDRLTRARLSRAVPGSGWQDGTDAGYLAEFVAYWRDGYDWRRAEAALNTMPQYTARAGGLDLHFVHAPGRGPAPLPLLFSHGWGGSFFEVHKILGPLTDPGAYGGDPADAFEVVAPSLPGFGFSPDPGRAGVHGGVIAEAYAELMTEVLGHRRFGLQGGDWGSRIVSTVAHRFPRRVAGLHLNLALLTPYLGPGVAPLTRAERLFVAEVERWQQGAGAYLAVHNSSPQSLAFGLDDSPVGLAGWLLDKFRAFSDCGGDLEKSFSRDELITNLMIYWVTRTAGSSLRLYAEGVRENLSFGPGERIAVPTAIADFPAEIFHPPREWVERLYDVRRFTTMPRGGHFAALEQPELLVEDIRAFFRPLRG
jgi:pimeloyl-ACP methyl ester carboxylesterase